LSTPCPLILCCYATLHPKTLETVNKWAPGAEFVDTSADDYAYCRELKARWNTGQDLITIEQDIEITADVVSSFENCDQDFCVFPYWIVMGRKSGPDRRMVCIEGLGCTRFSAALQARVKIRHIFQDDYRKWEDVAHRVWATVRRYGYYMPHVHYPLVTHHHDYGVEFENLAPEETDELIKSHYGDPLSMQDRFS